ncbi:MAG: PadR family transcriptional regulator [Alphaproteobacteria bacterium]|nr:PadR family transcriptional regulator [Alphaproteobacteria bacterium]
MDTKTLCLGVLTYGESSGYDVRKRLEDDFRHFMDVSSNAVYPALKALEGENLVKSRIVKQSNYPDKKIYSLTDSGRTYFTEALQILPPRHKVRSQFLLLLLFAEMLPAARMREIMAERLAELEHWDKVCTTWRQGEESKIAGTGPHFVVDYALATIKAEMDFIQENTNRLVRQLDQKGKKEK